MLDQIKKFTGGKGVDYLHLDNTFATIGEHFPSQKEAYHDLIKIIEAKRAQHNNYLQVNLYCYTLGKEELFDTLSRYFKTKVSLMKDAYLRMSLAGMDMGQRFVYRGIYDSRRDGPLWIYVKKMRDRPRTLEDINKKPGQLHVVLSGWNKQYKLMHPRYVKLPYSSHSSPEEIEAFVSALTPE